MARSNRSVIPIRSSSQSGLKKRTAPSSRISLGMCWLARLPDEAEVERDHKENEVEHSAASADFGSLDEAGAEKRDWDGG